jgi:phosphomannomutase
MALIKSVSGVRGITRADDPTDVTMNTDVAHRLGRAYATYLARKGSDQRRLMLVGGRDGRLGGELLLEAFADGARKSGVQAVDLGIVSTPGVAMMVKANQAAGGVVITASHNPGQWNGVKLMTSDGQAPPKAEAEKIFDLYDRMDFDDGRCDDTAGVDIDPHAHHVSTVLGIVDVPRIRDKAFHVALDSINGAGATAGRMLLEELGCRITHINADPADDFAHMPEPIEAHLTELSHCVRDGGADVGFAQDPDADRVAVVDDKGRFIGEEFTLALCAKRIFETHPGPAAANLSTSRLIDDIAAAADGVCTVYRSAVGEANVVEAMKAHDCVFGGEGNGGVIDPRVVHVRDSLVGMALVLDLLAAHDRTLSEVMSQFTPYAMIKEKVECDSERIARALVAVRGAFAGEQINDLDGVRVDWPEERKWVHVRGSNTEPIMRIIAEAPDREAAQALIARTRSILDASQ